MNEIDSKTKTLPDKAVATKSDDGSLSSLGLQRLPRQRRFHVPTVSLRELVGKKFWVCDFAPDVRTRYGEGRTVVLCKYNRDDAPEKAFKYSQVLSFNSTRQEDVNGGMGSKKSLERRRKSD